MLSSVTLFNLSARLALAISTVLSYAIFVLSAFACESVPTALSEFCAV